MEGEWEAAMTTTATGIAVGSGRRGVSRETPEVRSRATGGEKKAVEAVLRGRAGPASRPDTFRAPSASSEPRRIRWPVPISGCANGTQSLLSPKQPIRRQLAATAVRIPPTPAPVRTIGPWHRQKPLWHPIGQPGLQYGCALRSLFALARPTAWRPGPPGSGARRHRPIPIAIPAIPARPAARVSPLRYRCQSTAVVGSSARLEQ